MSSSTIRPAGSLAVHWMLIELGVPFEARLVDFETKAHKDPEYLRLNPDGMIPTLIVDGRPHAECAALALMLAERHPEGGLEIPRGTPERLDYLQWMLYFADTLQPLYLRPAGTGKQRLRQCLGEFRP